jgi:hypothetical protein
VEKKDVVTNGGNIQEFGLNINMYVDFLGMVVYKVYIYRYYLKILRKERKTNLELYYILVCNIRARKF